MTCERNIISTYPYQSTPLEYLLIKHIWHAISHDYITLQPRHGEKNFKRNKQRKYYRETSERKAVLTVWI